MSDDSSPSDYFSGSSNYVSGQAPVAGYVESENLPNAAPRVLVDPVTGTVINDGGVFPEAVSDRSGGDSFAGADFGSTSPSVDAVAGNLSSSGSDYSRTKVLRKQSHYTIAKGKAYDEQVSDLKNERLHEVEKAWEEYIFSLLDEPERFLDRKKAKEENVKLFATPFGAAPHSMKLITPQERTIIYNAAPNENGGIRESLVFHPDHNKGRDFNAQTAEDMVKMISITGHKEFSLGDCLPKNKELMWEAVQRMNLKALEDHVKNGGGGYNFRPVMELSDFNPDPKSKLAKEYIEERNKILGKAKGADLPDNEENSFPQSTTPAGSRFVASAEGEKPQQAKAEEIKAETKENVAITVTQPKKPSASGLKP